MAVKGAIAKQEILEKLRETFPNSFMEDAKILRIPWIENGETVEIKITMVAAKNVLGGSAKEAPAAKEVNISLTAPTDAEKADIEAMIRALGARIE